MSTDYILKIKLATFTFDLGSSLLCGSGETVYPIWNTVAGGSSTASTSGTGVGTYYPTEIASYVCDNITSSTYTSTGSCAFGGGGGSTCGVNTGFYRTPQRGPSLITGFLMSTGFTDNVRDPMTVTLEGSNQPASALTLGSSWTLIYSGISGLVTDPGRNAWGTPVSFSNNVWYASYRFLVTSKRSGQEAISYGEVLLLGY